MQDPSSTRNGSAARGGPLAGVRVVEFGGIGPGPFCGMLLADMGAEVTLIEKPQGTLGAQLFGGGRRTIANRGKRSIAVDLKADGARQMVQRLIRDADVLIEGFRPGVMERLGFGPETCLADNPRLVYGRMTGWGQTGPLAPRAGHDANYVALSGVLDCGRRHGEAPWAPPTVAGDMGGGLTLAWGIACALLEARRSGRGQVIDAAMSEASSQLAQGLFNLEAYGQWPARQSPDWRHEAVLDSGAPFYDVYRCADGGWISVCPLEPQFYASFLQRLGLAEDPDFQTAQYDNTHWRQQHARLTALFARMPRAHWEQVFADTDDCVWPVLSLAEAPRHPHNRAREAFVERDGVTHPTPSPRLSVTPAAIGEPSPLVGEQTREILRDAGYADSEIEHMVQGGTVVVGDGPV
ncbi:MAG TPA: CaiB/BaiF CoA-transferase family protein, partial [Rhodocyclaceae bacterium]